MVGPSEPATNRGRFSPVASGPSIGPAAHTAAARLISRTRRPEPVVGHRDAVGVEGVGRDDVGPGFEVAAVDRLDRLRLGDREQVVAAAEVGRMAGEFPATKILFREAQLLDHGAHGAVEDQDTFGREALKMAGGARSGGMLHGELLSGGRVCGERGRMARTGRALRLEIPFYDIATALNVAREGLNRRARHRMLSRFVRQEPARGLARARLWGKEDRPYRAPSRTAVDDLAAGRVVRPDLNDVCRVARLRTYDTESAGDELPRLFDRPSGTDPP